MDKIVQYIGYVSVISGFAYGLFKFLKPIYYKYKLQSQALSIDNIENIRDVAYKALNKAHMLIDHNKLLVYTCTPDGKCIYASKQLCYLYNQSQSAMLDYGWTLSINSEDRKKAFENWKRCVDEKLPYQDTYRLNGINGEIRVNTYADVVFEYDPNKKSYTDKILFYIGYVNLLA